MALVRCLLGKFLGVVCHCFPPIIVICEIYSRCNTFVWADEFALPGKVEDDFEVNTGVLISP